MKTELVQKIKDKCEELGIKGAVIGISGGKDSTIVAKLMVEALGAENVVGVMIPNGIQPDLDDSYTVVKLLGIRYIETNINGAYEFLLAVLNDRLQDLGKEGLSQMAKVNIAPRLRMTVLYSVCQSLGHGWRVIGTTNKSENYIGWLTKWGDGAADFEPIIEYTKSEVIEIGKELKLPDFLINKTPADGLTGSSDEDKFGFSYDQLDTYLACGISGDPLVDQRIQNMHNASEHKRNLIPKVDR